MPAPRGVQLPVEARVNRCCVARVRRSDRPGRPSAAPRSRIPSARVPGRARPILQRRRAFSSNQERAHWKARGRGRAKQTPAGSVLPPAGPWLRAFPVANPNDHEERPKAPLALVRCGLLTPHVIWRSSTCDRLLTAPVSYTSHPAATRLVANIEWYGGSPFPYT